MSLHAIIETLHIVFVIAWMSAVFYLPRILVNIAEAGEVPAVRERLVLMGRRLYRFGHIIFGIALLFGLTLWQGWRFLPNFPAGVGDRAWIHAKLLFVALLLVHFIVTGRWLKGAGQGVSLPSSTALRWYNEIPVLLLVGVIWMVVAKPF